MVSSVSWYMEMARQRMELIRKLSTLSAGSAADGGGNAAATTANDIDADEELARQLAAKIDVLQTKTSQDINEIGCSWMVRG